MEYEIRTALMWPEADYELRATTEGLRLDGYAAVFGMSSLPMRFAGINGGRPFREIIEPGAFAESLAGEPDVSLRFQHDMNSLPLGRTRSGTLRLSEDTRGLRAEADLPDSSWGNDIATSIRRGDIAGMSFRFAKVADKWGRENGEHVRRLQKVHLGPEVSLTDYPAYPDTAAAVRFLAESADVDVDELADAFRALREEDATLTPEQHALLIKTINERRGDSLAIVDPKIAAMRERLKVLA